MITAITFQSVWNKKYVNESTVKVQSRGEYFINDLQEELSTELIILERVHKLISMLNNNAIDWTADKVKEAILFHFDKWDEKRFTTVKTKKYRTFWVHGLIIHHID